MKWQPRGCRIAGVTLGRVGEVGLGGVGDMNNSYCIGKMST